MSLGFKTAGFIPVFAADNDKESLQTYSLNIGNHGRLADLSSKEPQEVSKYIESECGKVDILIGGPPCQGFSVQRRGPIDDPRNDLLLKHVEIGISLGVKVILIENVPTILGQRGKNQLDKVYKQLAQASYRVSAQVLQAADYGVPQLRRRAFVVAFKGKYAADFTFPAPICLQEDYMTVEQAFVGLPKVLDTYEEHPDISNHHRRKISDLNLKRISFVPEGGGRLDIPDEYQLPCHKKDNGHRHLDVYGRMVRTKPAPTITAMFDNFTRGRFGHPIENRNITNREGARLQTFPDSFIFLGNQKSVARQIGNAVPPKLAEAVAGAILSYLHEID